MRAEFKLLSYALPRLYSPLNNATKHKLEQHRLHGPKVYRCSEQSGPAEQELHDYLLAHLTKEQGGLYQKSENRLICEPLDLHWSLDSNEPLWNCSLWIADDLVIMEPINDNYCLTAASLCCPSHWRLEEKFGRPLDEIHDPIPGFHEALTPRINRFLAHLRPEHSVVRYNWSIQADDVLYQRPEELQETTITAQTPLYYRTERQSLRRLPLSGAIAFTIRVYLHPLETVASVPNALRALFRAIDDTPEKLQVYKSFDLLSPALEKYRELR